MNILKKYLDEKNETATAFANRSGVSQPTIWRLINGGTRSVSPSTALKIQEATGGVVKAIELLYPNSELAPE